MFYCTASLASTLSRQTSVTTYSPYSLFPLVYSFKIQASYADGQPIYQPGPQPQQVYEVGQMNGQQMYEVGQMNGQPIYQSRPLDAGEQMYQAEQYRQQVS